MMLLIYGGGAPVGGRVVLTTEVALHGTARPLLSSLDSGWVSRAARLGLLLLMFGSAGSSCICGTHVPRGVLRVVGAPRRGTITVHRYGEVPVPVVSGPRIV